MTKLDMNNFFRKIIFGPFYNWSSDQKTFYKRKMTDLTKRVRECKNPHMIGEFSKEADYIFWYTDVNIK